jgi:hypothetical protein
MAHMPQGCSRLTAIASCAAIVSGSIASVADAQAPATADAMHRALEIVAAVEQTGSCDITLHGAASHDEITERWLIAYSGVGPACDDSSALLQREGLSSNIAFFRRPNADEVKVLIGKIRASVRNGFDCLISFNGEPRFDDTSNLWTVRYYTSGYQCDDAAAELEHQGKELRVSFQRFR